MDCRGCGGGVAIYPSVYSDYYEYVRPRMCYILQTKHGLSRDDAEDVFGDAFLYFLRLNRGNGHPSTYFRYTLKRALGEKRKALAVSMEHLMDSWPHELQWRPVMPDYLVIMAEQRDILRRGICEAIKTDKKIMVRAALYYYVHGLRGHQISRVFGVSKPTAMSYVNGGIVWLRRYMRLAGYDIPHRVNPPARLKKLAKREAVE